MAFDPKCLDAGIEFGKIGDFELKASLCEFSLKLPTIPIPPITVRLPSISFLLPKLPFPKFSFTLSCDLDKPIDITAGIEFGGGRLPCVLPDPDEAEAA